MTCWLALTAVTAYLLDAAWGGVHAWASLGAAVVVSGAIAILIPREPKISAADLMVWLGIVVFITTMLLRMAMPSYLPTGRGPDLTHHLLLVDYIEQTHHLVHDRSLSSAMGEMAHYTPASHLLAVMAGQWFGTDGLHTFFPLVVLCAALTAGFVYLIARRISLSIPYAVAAATVLFLPGQYFFGAFTHDGFLSQTVSTLFAVAAWWGIMAWDDVPSTALACAVGCLLASTFLSWPIWIGPPLLVLLAALRRDHVSTRQSWRPFAIAIVPLLVVFLVHAWGRWQWMVIVRTSGAVLHPSIESVGWLLPFLALIGAAAGMTDRRSRIVVGFAFAIVVQALSLFVVAKAQNADTAYMALKMVYLLIYPMAVLAALAIARLVGRTRMSEPAGWLIAAMLLIAAVRPALAAPRNLPVVNDDLYQAGKWVRANGGSACADYLVGDAETAYWLHLAVLGNPRSSERTAALDRFDPRAAVAPWITAEGRAFGIADLRILPDEVRARVDVAAQFNTAAVIRRRDARMKGCD